MTEATTIASISIHAPLTGSDTASKKKNEIKFEFQSTPPSQGATGAFGKEQPSDDYFNPRPPHRERLGGCNKEDEMTEISIHAPLTGSDAYIA